MTLASFHRVLDKLSSKKTRVLSVAQGQNISCPDKHTLKSQSKYHLHDVQDGSLIDTISFLQMFSIQIFFTLKSCVP